MDEKTELKGVWYKRPIIFEEKEMGGEKKFFIAGNAIEVGVSRNKVNYSPEELKIAAKTLIGKPLLLNHGDNDVRNIMGKITDASFENNGVPFKAEIDTDEHTILSKLRKGYINSVSIGADYKSIDVDKEGIKHPKGLEFLELSLVPIAGVPNATISQVIEERFEIKKMEDENMEKEGLQAKIEELEKANKSLQTEKEELLIKVKEEEDEEKPEDEEKKEPEKPEESAVTKLEERIKELEKKASERKGLVDVTNKKEEPEFKMKEAKSDKAGCVDFYSETWREDY